MADSDKTSTTPAARAVAGTRDQVPPGPVAPAVRQEGEGITYQIGPGAVRGVRGRPYQRNPGDPLYRPLRIYLLDPSASPMEGATAVVDVPFEPLEPGPRGRLFEVDPHDGAARQTYRSLDLDEQSVLLGDGVPPSPANPLFHQQMVYAVGSLVYAAFRTALGRHPSWGFEGEGTRLRLRPYAFDGTNACYDRSAGEIAFGYYRAGAETVGRNLPRGLVFTSLSHDIIVHEITHALLDGLRARFCVPTGGDVSAFHEAFADVVAILQRFSYRTAVEEALRGTRGEVREGSVLTDLARQFGQTVEGKQALRSIDLSGTRTYDPSLAPHDLGGVLVSAVFDALNRIYKQRAEPFLRLATGGSGILPPGEIPPDLRALLAAEAKKTAAQFLSICIRAIDYCPPVDIEFGEYLRAVITADRDLVPDDRYGYRQAWIDAFGARGIYPRNVRFLSQDALLWEPPRGEIGEIAELSFAALRFEGDPACPAGEAELRRQAGALGRVVTAPGHLGLFGLARDGDPRLKGDRVGLPMVESIRSSRRVGPDGQVVFDLVAEIIQTRNVRRGSERPFDFLGGCTLIIDPMGKIRYTIVKSVLNEERLERQRTFMAGPGRSR